MTATWLPDGRIRAPYGGPIFDDDGEHIGFADGFVELERHTDEWRRWIPHVEGEPPAALTDDERDVVQSMSLD